jgi:hypothetical protein
MSSDMFDSMLERLPSENKVEIFERESSLGIMISRLSI